ncbi:MAG: AarF/ABC1/UbiB kinase family protein [Pseudomonadota bacterium]
MAEDDQRRGDRNRGDRARGVAVPQGRMRRLARMGGLASGLVGGMAAEGARRLAAGERPALRDMLLTPGNARRVADRLSEMRGAAMKLGQLLSMEADDVLTPELAEILSRLRAAAEPMPSRQLKAVLSAAWGPDFLSRFERFDVRPIAAASIGQVHRARAKDGRELAIKLQYPGVRDSIDSDVDNLASLMRFARRPTTGFDLDRLLAEAKRQLHEEADYEREARYLSRFGALLADDAAFALPALAADLSGETILAMSFVEGAPIERLETATQEERDAAAFHLIRLALRELFEFGVMQTDPNFANYLYQAESRRIVLLDFGASREISAETQARFRHLLHAAFGEDRETIRRAAIAAEIFAEDTAAAHQNAILDMIDLARAPLKAGFLDFGATDLTRKLRAAGMALGMDGEFAHLPPTETLFIQRKLAGLYFLASRLKARLDLSALFEPYREKSAALAP